MSTRNANTQPASRARGTFSWRNLFKIDASGVRTALTVVVPLLLGQLAHHTPIGLMIGLGGLYITIADKAGATVRSMAVAVVGVAVTAFLATLAGNVGWIAALIMFLLAFCGSMASVYGIVANNIGFAMTVAFAILMGLPNGLPTGAERFVEFTFGGLWGTFLTVLLWRYVVAKTDGANKPQPQQQTPSLILTTPGALLKLLRDNLTWRSEIFQHAIRLATASTIAVILYRILHLPHGTWLTLTTLVIVKPDIESTRQRAWERMGGSVLGGALAIFVVVLIHNMVVLDLLLLLFCVLAYSHLNTNYGIFTIFLTPFVVLLIHIATPGNWHIALVRMGDTLAGGALALLTATLLKPRDPEPG